MTLLHILEKLGSAFEEYARYLPNALVQRNGDVRLLPNRKHEKLLYLRSPNFL